MTKKDAPAQKLPDNGPAAWGLPTIALTERQILRLQRAAMALNTGSFNARAERLDPASLGAHAKALTEGADAVPNHIASLAPSRLKRSPLFMVGQGGHAQPGLSYAYAQRSRLPIVPELAWFTWEAPITPYGFEFLTHRRGTAAKSLISAGIHPASFFCRKLDASDMPGPAACAEKLAEMSASVSIDACTSMFNALDAHAPDKAIFREGAAQSARARLARIWLGREGVANAAERKAVAQCAFMLERLAKKKAMPADLAAVADEIGAKRATFKLDDSTAAFEFSPLQLKRMKTLITSSEGDDMELFARIGELCGIDDPAAYAGGVPKGANFEWPQGRYWSTKLASSNKFMCASWLLDQGDNPWLCAGDGRHGVAAAGNPFSWMASHSSADHAGWPVFCASLAKAALRDAETRSPGSGLEHCLASFEESRSARPDLWAAKGASAALAACESNLIPTMLAMERAALGAQEDPAEEPSAPSRPRSRL